MNTALFYRRSSRWRFWYSLAAALAIHVGAVVFAGLAAQAPAIAVGDDHNGAVFVTVDALPNPIDPEPPARSDELSPPTPPLEEPEFIDSENTPAPASLSPRAPRRPIAREPGTNPGASSHDLHALTVFAPRPAYPYEARRHQITGAGVALFQVETATGRVIDVTMLASTGSNLLDQSTVSALRRWRFRTGTPARVQCPITFTLSGAQY